MTQFAVCCAHLLPLKKEIGVELLPPTRSFDFYFWAFDVGASHIHYFFCSLIVVVRLTFEFDPI
jgi:hypothetical protein